MESGRAGEPRWRQGEAATARRKARFRRAAETRSRPSRTESRSENSLRLRVEEEKEKDEEEGVAEATDDMSYGGREGVRECLWAINAYEEEERVEVKACECGC